MSEVAGNDWHRYSKAMRASLKLMGDDMPGALRVLDDALATAARERQNQWVLTLSHRAANIARFLGDWPRVKHYYQQSLEFNPENPRALSGLADVAEAEGELEQAKEYAARCYKALIEGDNFLKKERLETLLHKWPEVGSTLT
jgi:tetratricopeptide (TPR) repeat protein